MKENQRFPEPIITPTTKADEGHDMNISKEEIIAQGIVSKEDYEVMEDYTRKILHVARKLQQNMDLYLLIPNTNLAKEMERFISLTKFILPTVAATSMLTVMKKNLLKVSHSVSCQKSLYANGLLSTIS